MEGRKAGKKWKEGRKIMEGRTDGRKEGRKENNGRKEGRKEGRKRAKSERGRRKNEVGGGKKSGCRGGG